MKNHIQSFFSMTFFHQWQHFQRIWYTCLWNSQWCDSISNSSEKRSNDDEIWSQSDILSSLNQFLWLLITTLWVKWAILCEYISPLRFMHRFSYLQFIYQSITLNLRNVIRMKRHALSWWLSLYFSFIYRNFHNFCSLRCYSWWIRFDKSHWKELEWLYYCTSWIWIWFRDDINSFFS